MNLSSAHLAAIAAFSLWGLLPIYWKILIDVSAWDLFAYRLLWAFLTLLVVLTLSKKLSTFKSIWNDRRKRVLLSLSAGLISSNWLLYIYAVTHGKVLEASMGYFLNPIILVFMGRIIFKERIRKTQWPSVILALTAIILIAIQSDIYHIPWLALLLSITFALYGLIRKMVQVGSLEGLFFETSIVILPVMIGWFFQETSPLTVFSLLPSWKLVVLAFSGVLTCLPLVLFAYGAKRLPFSTLGFFQYLSPSFKFMCGLIIFNETLQSERLHAFILIWIALVWYTAESYLVNSQNFGFRRNFSKLFGNIRKDDLN